MSKRTRPTTSTADASHKKQRNTGHAEIPRMNFTDEEYATFLKVLQQVNEATPEMLLLHLRPSLKHVHSFALNLVEKVSNDDSLSLICGPSSSGATTNSEATSVSDAIHSESTRSFFDLLPAVILEHKIIPFLNVRDLAVLRPTCRWSDKQWHVFLERNTFRVPEEVPTIDEAMRVGTILSKQKIYSKEHPLEVVLSGGEHVVEGSFTDSDGDVYQNTLEVTCSNISFVGKGKDKTTVRGGFGVENKKNVSLQNLILTNPNEFGLIVVGEEASVEMLGVSVKNCRSFGLIVRNGASVKATRCDVSENASAGVYMNGGSKGFFTDCTIHHNGHSGVGAFDVGTLVELRGELTKIHHNKHYGLYAFSDATINIHIPSRPITALVHDNTGSDLDTYSDGKIQSQLSSSSMELTVIRPAAH